MKPLTHFLSSLALAIIIFPFFHWKSLMVFAGGFLIDADHYLWYIYKYRNFSLLKAYKHFSSHVEKLDFTEDYGILIVFHTIEFLTIMLFLSFYSAYALIFTFGLLLHYVLDLIFLLSVPKRFVVDHSLVHWVMKNR